MLDKYLDEYEQAVDRRLRGGSIRLSKKSEKGQTCSNKWINLNSGKTLSYLRE